jgi:hypothetical protein
LRQISAPSAAGKGEARWVVVPGTPATRTGTQGDAGTQGNEKRDPARGWERQHALTHKPLST